MSDTHPLKTEVAIAGGGMVGLTLGLALARAGIATIVIDQLPTSAVIDAKFDGRVSAIAHASCRMLKALGLWPHLETVAQPILDIMVTDGSLRSGAAAAFLHFDHRDIGDEPLGNLIENRHYRLALQAMLDGTPALTLITPQRVAKADARAGATTLTLGDGRQIEAALCIAAEGRNSPLREAAGIKTIGWSYAQTGIVATIAHERDHRGVAHELFLPSGPFAILPMTGKRSSIVWTERSDLAPAFLKMGDEAFAAEVAKRFGDHWGWVRPEGPRWSYPLSLHLALSYTAPRLALAGDTAHGIHPIAGQGLNLGLRDVAALAEVLVEAKRLGLDIGSAGVLARYQSWRRFDNVVLAASTDLLNRLFSNSFAPLALARRFGLDLVDSVPPLKRLFMRHAGGAVGELPRLLKGEAL
ncbi:MAG: 2-octaprenyl-6-methoxyphenyl hydroxylase [Alphaproteobacteria bacterium]|nr:2-octaprenyl-6-methoxyphenyl hydroxylase [Alphaproteobacteria bacterium]